MAGNKWVVFKIDFDLTCDGGSGEDDHGSYFSYPPSTVFCLV